LILACGTDSVGARIGGGKDTMCSIVTAAATMRRSTMRLTDRTDYALCVLMYLAVNGEGLATVDEIAEHFSISRHHVARVVWKLGRAGFVETVRGRGGGLRLARAAESISVGAVARHTEGTIPLAEYSPGDAYSLRITSRSIYREVFAQAGEAFFAVLDRYTVGDLVKGNRRFRASLSSSATR